MRRIVILAEGSFDWQNAKTAVAYLRYSQDTVVAIIDSTHAGQDASPVLGDPGWRAACRWWPASRKRSCFSRRRYSSVLRLSVASCLHPGALRCLSALMEAGLEIVSGLHFFLGEDPELAAVAQITGAHIWDVRRPPDDLAMRIRQGTPHRAGSHVVSFCGTDCNVGKMTVWVELDRAARRRGLSSVFAATGQTGMMISGTGIPADRFISDFVSGAVEGMVLDFAEQL